MRPIVALLLLLLITAAWWALALWPMPTEAPDWLARTRAVCFGASANGLPDLAGWIGLIGEPLGMLAVLLVVWGRELALELRGLRRSWPGRCALLGLASLLALGGASAALRVSGALAGGTAPPAAGAPRPARLRLDAPAFRLIDQNGERLGLDRFRGQVVLLSFVYAHCQSVCPLILRELAEVRRSLGPEAPPLLLVTLDPWRDTPERLPALAREWKLDAGTHLLSGPVADVEAMLDAWRVPRGRDPKTGSVAHPSLAYLIDGNARIAYVVSEKFESSIELIRALRIDNEGMKR